MLSSYDRMIFAAPSAITQCGHVVHMGVNLHTYILLIAVIMIMYGEMKYDMPDVWTAMCRVLHEVVGQSAYFRHRGNYWL